MKSGFGPRVEGPEIEMAVDAMDRASALCAGVGIADTTQKADDDADTDIRLGHGGVRVLRDPDGPLVIAQRSPAEKGRRCI